MGITKLQLGKEKKQRTIDTVMQRLCIPPLFFPYLLRFLSIKLVFPLPCTGCYFVLYKSISGRPNSVKHAQEGLPLLWLQKVCFLCFILSFKQLWLDSYCSSALSANMSVTDFHAVQTKKRKKKLIIDVILLPSSLYIHADCISTELTKLPIPTFSHCDL